MANVIEFKNIKKQLGTFTLNLPTLAIEEGYITGFVGQNGAGKTTTIKLIMGMLFPDQGEIHVLDHNAKEENEKIKQEIGYVGTKMGFFPELKLKHIKASIAPFYTNWDEELYKRYITRFQLDENKAYRDLSTGKQKQFDLLLALSHHPKLLILDEPTANLDPLARSEFLSIFHEQMAEEEISIFYSSHITTDLEKAADYIIFIHDGEILLQESKDELQENYRIVRGDKSLLIPEIRSQFINLEENQFNFEGLTKNWRKTYELLGEEAVYDKASLEDIFIGHTKNKMNLSSGVTQ